VVNKTGTSLPVVGTRFCNRWQSTSWVVKSHHVFLSAKRATENHFGQTAQIRVDLLGALRFVVPLLDAFEINIGLFLSGLSIPLPTPCAAL